MKKEKLVEKQPFKDKIAIICGASEGLGKATAELFIELGGNVCIIARRLEILQQAAKEIKNLKVDDSQFVEIISCDTTDMVKLKPLLEEFITKKGMPHYLINSVGYCRSDYIQNLPLEDFKNNMDVNYYGQLIPTLILLPYFMKAKEGHIAFVSSMGGFLAFMGFTTYSPTKFALVGLAEALRNELMPYNIDVSIIYPPAMDTAGFVKENETKPEECAFIEGRAGLEQPKEIAETFILKLLKRKFNILPTGEAKLIWRVKRLIPGYLNKILDKKYRKALKKMGKKI